MVDAKVARVLGLRGLLRVDDGDVGSTTALGVLDDGTGSLARRSVLASRSVGHGVVKLQVAVELRRNLELLDGGLLDTLAVVTADLGALFLVLLRIAGDTLALESPGGQLIPLAKLLATSEAIPLESFVRIE